MKTIKVDYEMDNGHIMTIEGKSSNPFEMSDMHQLEMNMLHANRVPSFLPITWNEVDGILTFSYSIQSYKQFLHSYQLKSISMLDYYSILLSLVDCLATCYDYMLRPECCLIDEKLIYINPSNGNLSLAYIPLVQQEDHVQHQLLFLAVKWSQLVEELDHSGYQKLLVELTGGNVTINRVRQLLLDLIHSVSTYSEQEAQDENQQFPANHYSSRHAIDGAKGLNRNELVEGTLSELVKDEKLQVSKISAYDDEDSEEEKRRGLLQTLTLKHWLILVICVAVSVLTWQKLYFTNKSNSSLLLCSGISLILLTLVVLIFKQHWKVMWYEVEDDNASSFDLITTSQSFAPSLLSTPLVNVPSNSNMSEKVRSPLLFNGLHKSNNEAERYVKETNVKETVVLDSSQSTTLLQKVADGVTLKRILHQEEHIVPLLELPFLIGRADEGVHYQDEATGVSRVHLEVLHEKGEVYVKDVGSRNGSYLNGQLMVAYKAYVLQLGDTVQLVSKEGPKYQLAV